MLGEFSEHINLTAIALFGFIFSLMGGYFTFVFQIGFRKPELLLKKYLNIMKWYKGFEKKVLKRIIILNFIVLNICWAVVGWFPAGIDINDNGDFEFIYHGIKSAEYQWHLMKWPLYVGFCTTFLALIVLFVPGVIYYLVKYFNDESQIKKSIESYSVDLVK